jgi:ATP-dependent DNA helicase PIF1
MTTDSIQLIISGDFLQLPPVGPVNPDGRRLEPTMAFDAKSWRRVIPDINRFELSKVYRQADSTFVRLLNRLRRGLVDDEDVDRLVACNRPLNFNDGIEATQL